MRYINMEEYHYRIIRAPVPWHEQYRERKEYCQNHLFTTNQMMLILQDIWHEQ